jgi:hypothetical protein
VTEGVASRSPCPPPATGPPMPPGKHKASCHSGPGKVENMVPSFQPSKRQDPLIAHSRGAGKEKVIHLSKRRPTVEVWQEGQRGNASSKDNSAPHPEAAEEPRPAQDSPPLAWPPLGNKLGFLINIGAGCPSAAWTPFTKVTE